MFRKRILALLAVLPLIASVASAIAGQGFVSARGGAFYRDGSQYTFVGANYWYGGLLGLEKDRKRGVERLRKELDLLKKNGVTNLRLPGGAEGTGPSTMWLASVRPCSQHRVNLTNLFSTAST
ncbi:MAG: hypothetical protein IPP63_10475 [Chloracidobacterium sp.]|nr:hypothetical protein [Chloracidobacterium sp.]